MSNAKKWIISIGVTVVSMVAIGYVTHVMDANAKASNASAYKKLWDHGRECRKAGVPASANPHVRWPSEASAWLDGWIAADKEAAK